MKHGNVTMAVLLPLLAVSLAGCAAPLSPNLDACKLYESEQNDMTAYVELAREKVLTPTDVRAELALMPAKIEVAADRAYGDVLVAMEKSVLYAANYQRSQTEDSGIAYFMQRDGVVASCEKDGAPITINKLG